MKKEIGIYIHIPFCKSKCYYCDFNSFVNKENYFELYKNALLEEIKLFENKNDYIVKSIFIGGGTPTVIPIKYIEEIISCIYKFNIKKDAEITIEANPGTLNLEVLRNLKNININRISIGLQAWQNNLLKKLGRIHTIEEFLENYNNAIKVGFNNINIDLMFSLPDQTLKEWEETLKNIVDLKPKHISCYSLIIEENTPFFDLHNKNKLNLPDDELDRKMYHYTKNFLKENNYKQYEISNFALDKYECRHNLIYWNLEEYKGFGLGACSLLNNYRSSNITSLKKYIDYKGDINKIKETNYKLSLKDQMEEYMFLGLRLKKGILKEDFKKRFLIDIDSIYGNIIEKYVHNGLLINNERIYLTEKGQDISNTVMADFLL